MRKYIFFKFLVLFLMIFSFAGCAGGVQYNQQLYKWTRKSNLYSFNTLDVRILFRATYLSDEFRNAAKLRIDEWMKTTSADYIPDVNYLNSYESGQFLVSIYTPKFYPKITDKSSHFWEFRLELEDGRMIAPQSVTTVEVTEREIRLFPYMNRWSKFYYVKFPVASLKPPFQLALRSAGGTSILKWKVGETDPDLYLGDGDFIPYSE